MKKNDDILPIIQRRGYVPLAHVVLNDPTLSCSQKCIWALILGLMSNKLHPGWCYAGADRIAATLGLSERKVRSDLSEMAHRGFLDLGKRLDNTGPRLRKAVVPENTPQLQRPEPPPATEPSPKVKHLLELAGKMGTAPSQELPDPDPEPPIEEFARWREWQERHSVRPSVGRTPDTIPARTTELAPVDVHQVHIHGCEEPCTTCTSMTCTTSTTDLQNRDAPSARYKDGIDKAEVDKCRLTTHTPYGACAGSADAAPGGAASVAQPPEGRPGNYLVEAELRPGTTRKHIAAVETEQVTAIETVGHKPSGLEGLTVSGPNGLVAVEPRLHHGPMKELSAAEEESLRQAIPEQIANAILAIHMMSAAEREACRQQLAEEANRQTPSPAPRPEEDPDYYSEEIPPELAKYLPPQHLPEPSPKKGDHGFRAYRLGASLFTEEELKNLEEEKMPEQPVVPPEIASEFRQLIGAFMKKLAEIERADVRLTEDPRDREQSSLLKWLEAESERGALAVRRSPAARLHDEFLRQAQIADRASLAARGTPAEVEARRTAAAAYAVVKKVREELQVPDWWPVDFLG